MFSRKLVPDWFSKSESQEILEIKENKSLGLNHLIPLISFYMPPKH